MFDDDFDFINVQYMDYMDSFMIIMNHDMKIHPFI